jgi:hypothetical protein
MLKPHSSLVSMTNLLFAIESQLKPDIEGLGYVEGFISTAEEKRGLAHVDAAPWISGPVLAPVCITLCKGPTIASPLFPTSHPDVA